MNWIKSNVQVPSRDEVMSFRSVTVWAKTSRKDIIKAHYYFNDVIWVYAGTCVEIKVLEWAYITENEIPENISHLYGG
jgi:hypothetical protein